MPETSGGRKNLQSAVLFLGLIIGLLFLWYVSRSLLLGFSGILLAVGFAGIADVIERHLKVRRGIAISLGIILVFLVIFAILSFIIPGVLDQWNQLATSLPGSFATLQSQPWAKSFGFQSWLPHLQSLVSLEWIASFFKATYNVVLEIVLVLFIGVALALEPGTYVRGFLSLIPPEKRPETRYLLKTLNITLRRWFVGQLLTMLTVGILTAVGLKLIGIKLAFTLGIIAGLLEFVPNLGPILAAIPAVLVAIPSGAWPVVSVIIVYAVIQMIESYLLIPVIHRYTVAIPPVLAIISVLFMGSLFGPLGVLLAMPLFASLMVIVKILYIEGVLGEKTSLPGIE